MAFSQTVLPSLSDFKSTTNTFAMPNDMYLMFIRKASSSSTGQYLQVNTMLNEQ
jgi:hypothetical protein